MTKPIKNQDTYPIKDTLEKLLQIRHHIIGIFSNSPSIKDIRDMPDSMIPTDLLLNISMCYEVLYDKLIEDGLLKVGGHKTDKHLH